MIGTELPNCKTGVLVSMAVVLSMAGVLSFKCKTVKSKLTVQYWNSIPDTLKSLKEKLRKDMLCNFKYGECRGCPKKCICFCRYKQWSYPTLFVEKYRINDNFINPIQN